MSRLKLYQFVAIVSFIGVLLLNYLAVSLPLGGNTTGELSDFYPNLFTPAGFTFSIWGVIYLALLIYIVFQAKSLFRGKPALSDNVVEEITPWFILSCVCNMLWIVLWHYQMVLLSVMVMLGILYSLFQVVSRLYFNERLGGLYNKLFFKVPFGLYLGWILVATVANTTALLVDLNWDGFGLSDVFWTISLIVIATLIAIFTAAKLNNIFVGLSVIWALYGIVSKRFAEIETAPYEIIPYLGIACMVVLTIAVFIIAQKKTIARVD
ncbi:MAG: hypothetical protein NWQ46_00630 [Spirosomaceae bacterium]|nr:hypothetical protein [Spirosomataceae bacterium]